MTHKAANLNELIVETARTAADVPLVVHASPWPDEITFEADGKQHTAVVGLPTQRRGDLMTREYDGTEYHIYISLTGGFVARPITEVVS